MKRKSNIQYSIIIPAYNEEQVLEEAVNSLFNQTITKDSFEIILLNDNSSDNTSKVMRQLAIKGRKKGIKVTVKNGKENKGPGFRKNQGAKIAKGDILIFVDADMVFDKKYIEILVNPIRAGKEIGTSHSKELIANPKNWIASAFSVNRIPNPPQYTGVFRAIKKKTFLESGGFDPSKGYFDDEIGHNKGAKMVPAKCYHNNPESLREVFTHSQWVGKSLFKASTNQIRVSATLGIIALLGITLVNVQIAISIIMLLWLTANGSFFYKRFIKSKQKQLDPFRSKYLITMPIVNTTRLAGVLTGALKNKK